jgi:hypothetical protein
VYELDDNGVDSDASGSLDIHPLSGSMIIQGAANDPQAVASTVRNFAGPSGVFDVHSGTVYLDGMRTVFSHEGPGVHVRPGAHVTLTRDQIDENEVGLLVDAGGAAEVRNTLFSENVPNTFDCCGQAVVNHGTVAAVLSTFRGNLTNDGSFTTAGSVLWGPSTPGDSTPSCTGAVASGGYNIAIDGSCHLPAPTDLVAADLGLDLSYSVPTSVGSPVVDSIPIGTPPLCDDQSGFNSDARFGARPQGSGCDRGAFERATASS